MRQSLAVIQTSLFEGWSTSVEEAIALGKQIILSDIPVHREQNPKQGVYFDPNAPVQLASILENIFERGELDKLNPDKEAVVLETKIRQRNYAEKFLDIVEHAICSVKKQ